jgi:predicted PurR-regulated permease PerM
MNETDHKTNASQILIVAACFVVVIAGMILAKDILVPFLLAVFISIIASPPLFWLKGKGLPTWLSLIIVILGVLLIALLIGWLIGSSVASFTQDLPVYEARLKQYTASTTNWLERLGVDTSGFSLTEIINPGAAMSLVGSLLSSLGNMLTNGFLILMTVIFILLEASGFPAKLRTALGGSEFSLVRFDSFISNVQQYMTIKTWISLATGLLVTIWLAVLGVDYALLWGVLAFALNYVPNIGSIIAAVPAVLLAMIQLGFWRAIAVAVGYLAINLLMGSVIEPRFMGRGLGLSTLVVFLSLIFWGWVLGPVGMLLSVPLTMTAKIALDSRDDTHWIAVLLGPQIAPEPKIKKNDKSSSKRE